LAKDQELEKHTNNLPWLERQYEAQKLITTVRKIKEIHVYSSDEIIRVVGERYRRLRPRRPGKRGRIEFELKRLETVFNVAYSRLKQAAEMPNIESLSTFHRSLVDSFIGSEQYIKALKRVRKGLRLIRIFWNEYRLLILSSQSPSEAARLRREGSGRILSVIRRLKKDLEVLSKTRVELLKTHIIAEGLPIVVVAGIPSAGKSTLVAALSTAEPEIASYPFTTKQIIVGKVTSVTPNFYIVDTPGILERPPEEHNVIERKALAALRSLPDVVVYLFDPSIDRVQDIDKQIRLLESIVHSFIKDNTALLVLAINKIDAAEKEALDKLEETLDKTIIANEAISRKLCHNKPLRISALKRTGLETLLEAIMDCLKKTTPWLFVKYN
jgi:nucleolar GTP-binding protein